MDGSSDVTDVDDAGIAITTPTDHSKIKIYRNGILQAESGTSTTRDYEFSGNDLIFEVALTSADVVIIEKIA